MADPLSIIAGAVGIAAFTQELARSVLKIKNFCKEVQNAPVELQETLDQIENIARIMARLSAAGAQDLDTSVDEDVLKSSLELCQKSASRVSAVAKELGQAMKKRKYLGAVRKVVKKRVMDALLLRLDRTKMDLLLAHSIYADARRQKEVENMRLSLAQARLSVINKISPNSAIPEDETNNDSHSQSLTRRRRSKKSPYAAEWIGNAHVRLPQWLCQYAWDVALQRASGCWTMSFRTYKILPQKGRVWDMCTFGDIRGITNMLERRELCIHDEFEEDFIGTRYSLFSVRKDLHS